VLLVLIAVAGVYIKRIKERAMRRWLGCLLFVPILASAASIATMPNEGGGKIVLTDDVCKYEGKTFNKLNRAYNYTTSGHSSEGCFYVEDETVVVIWNTSLGSRTMRYPLENFTLVNRKQSKSRYGT
jgi:hypothetical protein